MAIDLGDIYRCAFTNTSPGGGVASADTMTLTIILPDGTAAAPVVVTATTPGVYSYDYLTTVPGRHLAHWVGTGTNPGAGLDAFDVRPADMPYIVSLADIKAQTNIASDTNDDELRPWVEAATEVIEEHLGQAVVRRTFVEDAWVEGNQIALTWAPVISLTSVVSADGSTTYDVTKFHVSQRSGVLTPVAGSVPRGLTTFTYIAGMQVIPAKYTRAACIIVQHLWETQRGNFGGPRAGGLEDSMGGGRYAAGFAIPNRALELLGRGIPGVA